MTQDEHLLKPHYERQTTLISRRLLGCFIFHEPHKLWLHVLSIMLKLADWLVHVVCGY